MSQTTPIISKTEREIDTFLQCFTSGIRLHRKPMSTFCDWSKSIQNRKTRHFERGQISHHFKV